MLIHKQISVNKCQAENKRREYRPPMRLPQSKTAEGTPLISDTLVTGMSPPGLFVPFWNFWPRREGWPWKVFFTNFPKLDYQIVMLRQCPLLWQSQCITVVMVTKKFGLLLFSLRDDQVWSWLKSNSPHKQPLNNRLLVNNEQAVEGHVSSEKKSFWAKNIFRRSFFSSGFHKSWVKLLTF